MIICKDSSCRKVISKGKEKIEKSLEVKFDFYSEVAPKDRNEVKKRIDYSKTKTYEYSPEENAISYVLKNDFYVNRHYGGNSKLKNLVHNGCGTKCFLYPNSRKLKLGIKLISKTDIDLESLVNLEELNEFILTGKKK